MALAVALLLSKGAYPTLLQRCNHLLPARAQASFEPLKVNITLDSVLSAFIDSGITMQEATSWDDFILQYGKDYLAMPDIAVDDDIHVAMQEHDHEGAHSDLAILECLSSIRQIPHLQTTWPMATNAPGLVPEGFDPEEGEYFDDIDNMAAKAAEMSASQ